MASRQLRKLLKGLPMRRGELRHLSARETSALIMLKLKRGSLV